MSYTDFSNKMLLALYRESDGDTSAKLDMGPLADKYGIEVSKPFWIPNLKTEWGQVGWAHFPEDGTGRSETVVINLQGVRQAEMMPEDVLPAISTSGSSIGPNDVFLYPLPRSSLSLGASAEAELAPASDRIVGLDHNSLQYQQISTGLDQLFTEVEQNNAVGASASERDRLLRSLNAARELWKSTELKVLQIKVGVILAIEDASAALVKVGKKVGWALLIDALKEFVKNKTGIEL